MSDDTQQDGTLRYDIWVEAALRRVIYQSLSTVSELGLSGEHHFYISFLTKEPGVVMPERLRAQHPNDMTIVLQHQFDDLDVSEDGFGVSLSFGGIKERLEIPYASIISFADPSVSFALQLKMQPFEDDEEDEEEFDLEAEVMELEAVGVSDNGNNDAKDAPDKDGKTGEVIALDAFRKK